MPSCTSDFYFPDCGFVVLESKARGGQHLCSADKPRLPRISLQLSEIFTRGFGVPWITAPEECCVALASSFYHFCFLTPPASWSQSPTIRPKPSTNSVPGCASLGPEYLPSCKCCLLRTTNVFIRKIATIYSRTKQNPAVFPSPKHKNRSSAFLPEHTTGSQWQMLNPLGNSGAGIDLSLCSPPGWQQWQWI